ncbi:MAG: hypothetical protein AB1756_03490 [Acidobacteriota bacterium]
MVSGNVSEREIYGYSRPAMFIPVVLALEVFLFGFFFYVLPPYPFRNEVFTRLPLFAQFRLLVFAVAFLLAIRIFQFFFQLRWSFQVGEEALIIRAGRKEMLLEYGLIEGIDYENMLGPSRKPFGFTLLRAKPSSSIRIYNILERGDSFIHGFLQKVVQDPFNRNDLKTWIEIKRIQEKMRRSRICIRLWYYLMGIAFLFFLVKGYII